MFEDFQYDLQSEGVIDEQCVTINNQDQRRTQTDIGATMLPLYYNLDFAASSSLSSTLLTSSLQYRGLEPVEDFQSSEKVILTMICQEQYSDNNLDSLLKLIDEFSITYTQQQINLIDAIIEDTFLYEHSEHCVMKT